MRLSATNTLAKKGTIAKQGGAPARLLAAFVFLLAFTFQSFVAQTHIHITSAPTGFVQAAAVNVSVIVSEQAPDQSPQDEASKCPLCQVATAMGAAVRPLAVIIAAPAFIAAATFHALPLSARAAPAHAWTSRGPPSR